MADRRDRSPYYVSRLFDYPTYAAGDTQGRQERTNKAIDVHNTTDDGRWKNESPRAKEAREKAEAAQRQADKIKKYTEESQRRYYERNPRGRGPGSCDSEK
jgi:hypothetical protein